MLAGTSAVTDADAGEVTSYLEPSQTTIFAGEFHVLSFQVLLSEQDQSVFVIDEGKLVIG